MLYLNHIYYSQLFLDVIISTFKLIIILFCISVLFLAFGCLQS